MLCQFHLGTLSKTTKQIFSAKGVPDPAIKVIFIQLQEFPTPPYRCYCSVTKRSDSGIAEALKALKMNFWDPSQ